jgi:hypothetical protein
MSEWHNKLSCERGNTAPTGGSEDTPAADAVEEKISRVMNTKGVLAIWHDIEPAHEQAVLNWYNEQHHIERVKVPGFIRARRYVASDAMPKYFICYETKQPEVMQSAAYLTRVNNPTRQTQAMMPHYQNTIRTVYRVVDRLPRPEGAHVLTVRVRPQPGADGVLRQHIVGQLLPALRCREMLMQAQLWEPDEMITTLPTEERAIRERSVGEADALAPWALVISASSPEVLDSVDSRQLAEQLASYGATRGTDLGRYELQYLLEKENAQYLASGFDPSPITKCTFTGDDCQR